MTDFVAQGIVERDGKYLVLAACRDLDCSGSELASILGVSCEQINDWVECGRVTPQMEARFRAILGLPSTLEPSVRWVAGSPENEGRWLAGLQLDLEWCDHYQALTRFRALCERSTAKRFAEDAAFAGCLVGLPLQSLPASIDTAISGRDYAVLHDLMYFGDSYESLQNAQQLVEKHDDLNDIQAVVAIGVVLEEFVKLIPTTTAYFLNRFGDVAHSLDEAGILDPSFIRCLLALTAALNAASALDNSVTQNNLSKLRPTIDALWGDFEAAAEKHDYPLMDDPRKLLTLSRSEMFKHLMGAGLVDRPSTN